MFNELERKNIKEIVHKYRSAHDKLQKNYNSRRNHAICNDMSNRAEYFLRLMDANKDKITSDDVEPLVLLVDTFDQMHRDHILEELQKIAKFDVRLYLENKNRRLFDRIFSPVDYTLKGLTPEYMKKVCVKYKKLCDKINSGKMMSGATTTVEDMRNIAYAYARSIVNGDVSVAPDNLKVAYDYLTTLCHPEVFGDNAYKAKQILNARIQNMDIHTEIEDFVSVQEDKNEPGESEHQLAEQARLKEIKKQERQERRQARVKNAKKIAGDMSGKVADAFGSVKGKLATKWQEKKSEIETAKQNREIIRDAERASKEHWKNLERQEKQQKLEQSKEAKTERHEKFAGFVIASAIKMSNKFNSVKGKLATKWQEKKSEIETAKQNRKIVRDAERASKEHWKNLEQQQPKNQKLEQLQNSMQAVSEKYENTVADVAMKVSGAIDKGLYNVGSVVSEIMTKHDELKAKRKTAKQNREIIRDAERASREHWKELKREEKQNKEPNKNRNLFVRVAVGTAVAAVLFGGIMLLQNNKHNKVEKEPVKKEVKAPVAHEKVVEPISVDTAYMAAMNNYCNSAMDIIAGAKKKNDVMSKLNNQVENGNLVLNDTISIERVAYTYFMYREYGFNIDVLNLAVNGDRKLSDAEQTELLNVINAAGERGKGVQQMAKQRVEARGGSLGKHSKFENATKAQQRAYLVNRGILKKAHTR